MGTGEEDVVPGIRREVVESPMKRTVAAAVRSYTSPSREYLATFSSRIPSVGPTAGVTVPTYTRVSPIAWILSGRNGLITLPVWRLNPRRGGFKRAVPPASRAKQRVRGSRKESSRIPGLC